MQACVWLGELATLIPLELASVSLDILALKYATSMEMQIIKVAVCLDAGVVHSQVKGVTSPFVFKSQPSG